MNDWVRLFELSTVLLTGKGQRAETAPGTGLGYEPQVNVNKNKNQTHEEEAEEERASKMSQRSSSDLPQPASTLAKMVKGSAKSSVPPSNSADMCRLPGSVGSASAASRFLTTPRLQDGYMTPSETQVESRSAFGHGRFQKTMLLCAQLATMLAYSYSFTLLFIDLEPVEHWCAPPQQFATLSEQTWKDIAIPRDSNRDFKQCERYEPLDAPASPLAASTSQCGPLRKLRI
nr:uncharacterized protein LOC119165117 [Rhipicephalus microplus]